MNALKRGASAIIAGSLVISCFFTFSNALDGTENPLSEKVNKIIVLNVGKSSAIVLGKDSKIDSTNESVIPFVADGRTLIPVRFISEAFGATVNWIANTKTIDITLNDINIKLVLGEKNMVVNGKTVEMDAAAISKDGRTFVPVRYIAEALGKKIFYDNGLIVISPSDTTIDATTDKNMLGFLRAKITMGRAGNGDGKRDIQRADEMGEVTAVDGNSITLKMIEMPSFSRQKPPQGADSAQPGEGTNNPPPDMSDKTSTSGEDTKTRGVHPEYQIKYSGESKTITISDSTPITKSSRGAKGEETSTLKVSDIAVGQTLSIWYSDKTSKAISKISVREKR